MKYLTLDKKNYLNQLGFTKFAIQSYVFAHDIIDILPHEITTDESNYYLTIVKYNKNSYSASYSIDTQDGSMNEVVISSDNILDVLYEMLIYVIVKRYIY